LVGAGIALALLYSNVLTFGGMMVAYMAEKGNRSAASIGLWKGLSDVAGFLGTVWFSRSTKDLETKALISLTVLLGCLTLSMAGIWRGVGGGIGAALVIAGVIPSRIGLWAYDLSVVQLYQNRVAPSLRGTIGGTQTILNNVAEFVPFVLGMVVSGVDDFWIVMVVGYLGVAAALLSYAKGTYYDYYYYSDYDHCPPDLRPTHASSSNPSMPLKKREFGTS
jgi:iron-regulated transporter 1